MRRISASLLAVWMVADAAQAQTSATWSTGATGVWSNASLWSTNPLYPCNGNGGQTFNASLSSGTATVDLDCAIQALTLSGSATVDGSFALTANALFTWSSGTLGGSGTTTASGGASITTTATKTFAGTRRLELGGSTSSWSAGSINMGTSGATLRNRPGSTLSVTGSASRSLLDTSDSATFQNDGTLLVNLDAPTTQLTCTPGTMNNTGVITVSGGELEIGSNGAHSGSFGGAGTLRFGAGAQSLLSGSSVTTASTQVTGGTLSVQPGATLSPPSLTVSTSGVLDVVDAGSNVSPGAFTLASSGTLTGAGALASSGLFTWSAGTMSGSGTAVANGGASITTTATKTFAGTRRLELGGSSSSWSAGSIAMGAGGATLRNRPGSTFSVTGSASRSLLDTLDSATFQNDGTLVVSLDTPTTQLTCTPGTLNNTGVITVSGGELEIGSNGAHSGSFGGAGTLRFTAGAQSLLSGSSVTTSSTQVTGGTLSVQPGATLSPPSLTVSTAGVLDVVDASSNVSPGAFTIASSGTLTGAGALTSSGQFTWSGGTMSGSGTAVANGGASITATSTKTFAGTRRLEIGGSSSSWTAGSISMGAGGATLQNRPGSTLTVTGTGRTLLDTNDSGTFLNDGTFTVSLDPGSTLNASPGTTRNTGKLEVLQGTLSLTTTYVQTSGVTRLAGGALSTGTPLDIQGGTLEGVGTLSGSAQCAGTFSPGLSAGRLTIAGNLTLQPGSRTRIELGGLVQGTSYDFSDVTGTLTLAGSLLPGLLPGFSGTITGGDQFTVLERSSGQALTGAFANVASGGRVVLNPGLGSMVVSYGAGSPFGAQRVVLHDFLPIVPETTFNVSGTAQGGTIALEIEGVQLVIPTSAGQTATQIAEAIAAAINANAALAALGVVGSALGASVGITGSVQSVPVVTDPGLALQATPSIPSLPPFGLLLLTLAMALTIALARRSISRSGL